jgi:hypothetical protein
MFKEISLKIRRPSNYDLATAIMLGPVQPDPTLDLSRVAITKPATEESLNKLFVVSAANLIEYASIPLTLLIILCAGRASMRLA